MSYVSPTSSSTFLGDSGISGRLDACLGVITGDASFRSADGLTSLEGGAMKPAVVPYAGGPDEHGCRGDKSRDGEERCVLSRTFTHCSRGPVSAAPGCRCPPVQPLPPTS